MSTACTRAATRRQRHGRRAAALLLFGLILSVAPTALAMTQAVPTIRPAAVHHHAAHIAEAAQRFGIPEHWIVSVMRAESAGDDRAISSAGAMGLMQIMPATWTELSAQYGLGGDPYAPRENILAGAAYLRAMYDRYGNVGAMLAAYNAGPGRYDSHLATGRPLPAETRAYVALLAPALSGNAPPIEAPMAPPPPPDWRDAPLFVPRFEGGSVADSVQPERISDDRRTAGEGTFGASSASPSDGLFVVRHAPGADR